MVPIARRWDKHHTGAAMKGLRFRWRKDRILGYEGWRRLGDGSAGARTARRYRSGEGKTVRIWLVHVWAGEYTSYYESLHDSDVRRWAEYWLISHTMAGPAVNRLGPPATDVLTRLADGSSAYATVFRENETYGAVVCRPRTCLRKYWPTERQAQTWAEQQLSRGLGRRIGWTELDKRNNTGFYYGT